MPQFYRIDGRRLTLREYRRISPNLLVFLMAAVAKALGGGARFTGLVPRLDRLYERAWADLPEEDAASLSGPVAGWERLGFRRLFVHVIPTPQRNRSAAVVVLLAPAGDAVIQVGHFIRPDGWFVWTCVMSRFADGTFGVTTTQKHELNDPPEVRRSQQPAGLTPRELWERHQENLFGRWGNEGLTAERLTEAQARELVLEGEVLEFEFHAERGLFVPVLDEDELDELIEKG